MLLNLLPMTKTGLTLTAFDIDAFIEMSDRKLFRQAIQPGHSLHCLLPPKTSSLLTIILTSLVKGNIHISFPLFSIRSLKIVISIVVYLNMYNFLVTSR